MLKELRHVRQDDNDLFRRCFHSPSLELIVWFDNQDEIVGFQLCYKSGNAEKALTWKKQHGYSHDTIDTGETSPTDYKASAMLVSDGVFNKEKILNQFRHESSQIDKTLTSFIEAKLDGYKLI